MNESIPEYMYDYLYYVCVDLGDNMNIRKALTLTNPAYVDAKKYGRYLKGIPKSLKYYEESERAGLIIPRGFASTVPGFEYPQRAREPVQFSFKGKLRPYQEQAVSAALQKNPLKVTLLLH